MKTFFVSAPRSDCSLSLDLVDCKYLNLKYLFAEAKWILLNDSRNKVKEIIQQSSLSLRRIGALV